MSDNEDTMMNGGEGTALDEKDQKPHSATSDDDDSSSSSSGSSSSSDSSDSESDGEGEQGGGDARQKHQTQHPDDRDAHFSDRKYSIESVASSNGLANSSSRNGNSNNASSSSEPLNVNSNRAAARFREQNSEVGLMALGTKKRDRRTIEEIQRDLQKKRGRSSLLSSSNGSRPPPSSSFALAGRASPPKGSPVLSPEPGGSDSSQLALGLPQMKMPKGKPNSARSRLNQKLFGRGNSKPAAAAKPAATKKQSVQSNSASSSTGAGMVTNISAGAKAAKPASSPNDLGA